MSQFRILNSLTERIYARKTKACPPKKDSDIRAEATATEHAAIYRFRYNGKERARLLYDGQWGLVYKDRLVRHVKSFSFGLDGNRGFSGRRKTFCWTDRIVAHKVEFSRPFGSVEKLPKRNPEEKGERYVFDFDLKQGETLCVRVSISREDESAEKKNGVSLLATPESINPKGENGFRAAPTWVDVAWNRCVGSTLSESCAEGMRVIPREQAENKEVKEWVHASYAVYGLDTSGDRTGIVSSAVREGRLEFTASVEGPRGSRMLYEIVRKN